MKKKKRYGLSLLMGVFILSWFSAKVSPLETQSTPLFTVTFYELGYNITQTYYQDGILTLQVNCTGSPIGLYSAKIYLHITGEDTVYSYRINAGPLKSGGPSPGCSFFTGWQESYLESGFFQEGINDLNIIVKNCDGGLTTTNKYLMIITDSYLEIYDGEVITENNSQTTVSSSTFASPKWDSFLGGFVVGALVISSILVAGYVLNSRRSRRESPTRRFIPRTPSKPVCSICKQNIIGERSVECPKCENTFHETHFAEAVKTTGQCPICKTNIITLDQNGDTQYTTWTK